MGHHAEQPERGALHVCRLAQANGNKGLGIVKSRIIAALGLPKRTQYVLGVFVAHARQVAHPTVGRTGLRVGRAPHQATGERSRKFLGGFVVNAQHRRQLVAILGLPAAAAKLNLLHQVGVDEAQALLLGRGYEKRPVNFEPVHVHQVLIIVAAAHVVRAAQLVITTHTGQGLEDGVKIAEGRRNFLRRSRVDAGDADLLALIGLVGTTGYAHIAQRAGIEPHVEAQGLGRVGG